MVLLDIIMRQKDYNMQTKEQIQQIILQLKARRFELTKEQEIVDSELSRNIGKFEILSELKNESSTMDSKPI